MPGLPSSAEINAMLARTTFGVADFKPLAGTGPRAAEKLLEARMKMFKKHHGSK